MMDATIAADVLWAFAKLRCEAQADVGAALTKQLTVGEMGPRTLSGALWSLTMLRLRPCDAVCASIFDRVEELAAAMKLSDMNLCSILWAASVLGFGPHAVEPRESCNDAVFEPGIGALEAALSCTLNDRRRPRRLTTEAAVTVLWSAATLGRLTASGVYEDILVGVLAGDFGNPPSRAGALTLQQLHVVAAVLDWAAAGRMTQGGDKAASVRMAASIHSVPGLTRQCADVFRERFVRLQPSQRRDESRKNEVAAGKSDESGARRRPASRVAKGGHRWSFEDDVRSALLPILPDVVTGAMLPACAYYSADLWSESAGVAVEVDGPMHYDVTGRYPRTYSQCS